MHCLQAGNILISIMMTGMHICDSPFAATISAGPISPSMTTIAGSDANGCVAGTTCYLQISARDHWSNSRLTGDDAISVMAPNGSATVRSFDAITGTYQVQGLAVHDARPSLRWMCINRQPCHVYPPLLHQFADCRSSHTSLLMGGGCGQCSQSQLRDHELEPSVR